MKRFKKRLAILSLAASMVTAIPTTATADADPFLGETMLFGGTFCPRGWIEAAGQLLPVASHDALFSLYGTMYGGDGRTTFGVPDLRGRAPVGIGQGPGLTSLRQGQKVGTDQPIVLTVANMPAHNHGLQANNQPANKGGPGDKYFGQPVQTSTGEGAANIYTTTAPNRTLAADALTYTGSGEPFVAVTPRLGLRWCVSNTGIYPPRD